MNILDRKIRDEIEHTINSIGFELMEIECSPNRNGLKIVTFIDHLDGVTLDDCVKASKVIEPILDNENEDGDDGRHGGQREGGAKVIVRRLHARHRRKRAHNTAKRRHRLMQSIRG